LFVDWPVAVVFVAGLGLSACGSSTPRHRGSAQNVAYCAAVTKQANGLGVTAPIRSQCSYLVLHQHLVSTLVGLAHTSVLKPTKDLVNIITLTREHRTNPRDHLEGAERDSNKIKDYCGIGG
jgi:hypothetical protein